MLLVDYGYGHRAPADASEFKRKEKRLVLATLKDKITIITGAGGGIGSKIAHGFGDKGAHLALVDRTDEILAPLLKELNTKGIKAVGISADITKETDIELIVKETESQLAPVDILLNVAGIMPFKLIKDTSADRSWPLLW